jgi:hypothetical protein
MLLSKVISILQGRRFCNKNSSDNKVKNIYAIFLRK